MKLFRELLAALALLFILAVTAWSYPTLPARIPTHFNAAGVANSWGDKSAIWLVACLGCLLYVVLTAASFAPARAFNVPVAQEKRAAAIPIAIDLVAWIKLEVMCLIAWLTWAIVTQASGRSHGFGMWPLPIVTIAIPGTIAFYFLRMSRLPASKAAAL